MSDEELRVKFKSLMTPVLGDVRAGKLAEAVGQVETTDVRALIGLTVGECCPSRLT